jgi:predicted nucleic acid-binding protein
MSLANLPAGSEVLLDANVLIYGLIGRSRQCEVLMRRCASGDVSGFTTVDALADVSHRLMLHEAFHKGLINRQNAASLKGKPAIVSQLSDYWALLETVRTNRIAVLPLDEYRFQRAHAIRLRHGLMTDDSILLSAADVFGLPSLATNDSDFDAVAWINIYKPTDLP